MKKKQLILVASLSMVAALGVAGGILASTANSAAAVKAEGEKTTIEFDITTYKTMNANVVLFNVDTEIPTITSCPTFNWVVNGKGAISQVYSGSSATEGMYLVWNGTFTEDAVYRHWRIPAGTLMFESDTAKYVLKNDYNFWRTRHSGGGDFSSWVWQHGDSSAVETPSFSFGDAASGTSATADGRYDITIPYTKTGSWKSASLWNGNAYTYAFDESTDYALGYTADDSNSEIYLLGEIEDNSNASGSERVVVYFSGLGTTTGTDKFISIYFPKGTLFGGCNAGYSCFLENDYYITIMNDRMFGSTKSTAEMIYTPVNAFVTSNMHMNDAAYDGTGTGACTSIYSDVKTAYNTLTENQKYAFLNYSGYTDAKARLLSWAAANGDALDASNSIVAKKSSSLILNGSSNSSNVYALAICAGALALAAGGAFFVFKKKREN